MRLSGRTRTGRCIPIARTDNKRARINEEITGRTCRLIGEDGSMLGLFGIRDALNYAEEQGLDLVEMNPNAEPPVCRVMDYSKYLYEQKRRERESRKKQTRVEVKEVQFRPKIDVGDYETKKRKMLGFLRKGNRIKVVIRFRGREQSHPEQGLKILERLTEDLKDYANVDQPPKMEGRNMNMTLSPIKGAFDKEEAAQAEAQDVEASE